MKKKLLAMLIACLCVTEAATVFVPVSEPIRVEAATKSTMTNTKLKSTKMKTNNQMLQKSDDGKKCLVF